MSAQRIFFTSDHHFGHAKAIAMNNRPFPDVDMMTSGMIATWNGCIHDGDVVYHLGDFAYRPDVRRPCFHAVSKAFCICGEESRSAPSNLGRSPTSAVGKRSAASRADFVRANLDPSASLRRSPKW